MEMRTPHFYFSFNCSLAITLIGMTISIPLLRSLTLQELSQWTMSLEPSVDGKWTGTAWTQSLQLPCQIPMTRFGRLRDARYSAWTPVSGQECHWGRSPAPYHCLLPRGRGLWVTSTPCCPGVPPLALSSWLHNGKPRALSEAIALPASNLLP